MQSKEPGLGGRRGFQRSIPHGAAGEESKQDATSGSLLLANNGGTELPAQTHTSKCDFQARTLTGREEAGTGSFPCIPRASRSSEPKGGSRRGPVISTLTLTWNMFIHFAAGENPPRPPPWEKTQPATTSPFDGSQCHDGQTRDLSYSGQRAAHTPLGSFKNTPHPRHPRRGRGVGRARKVRACPGSRKIQLGFFFFLFFF